MKNKKKGRANSQPLENATSAVIAHFTISRRVDGKIANVCSPYWTRASGISSPAKQTRIHYAAVAHRQLHI